MSIVGVQKGYGKIRWLDMLGHRIFPRHFWAGKVLQLAIVQNMHSMFEQGVYSFQAKCVCYYEVLFEWFLLPISTYHCRIPFLSMSLIMAVVGHESFWYFCWVRGL